MLEKGQKAPEIKLNDSDGNSVSLADYKGKWVALYFYPKDNTPGCTLEAIDFTNTLGDFERNNAVILGVSPDSEKIHCDFRDRHQLKVTLLSDPDHQTLEAYGVWVLKKMYGREYYGVERSTFLISPKGKIEEIWRQVKVNGHIDAVLSRLKQLHEE